jgi:zinc protease
MPALAWTKHALGNGFEVVLHRDDRIPMVSVNLWYHTGPVNEPPGRSGFAHLFEHLMFEGSKHAGRQFDYLLESVGGTNMNGTTNWDRTNYYETVPSEHLELALWLEADRMGFMIDSLTQERLDVQREVVKNERRQSYDNRPYGPSGLKLYDLLFPPGHPYQGAVIGSMEDLSRASMADVRAFFARYYAPANATLVLAGNFNEAEALALVQKHFGTLAPRGPRVARPKPITGNFKAQRVIVKEPVELGRITNAWLTPPAYGPDEAALEIATRVLASGKASRLYQALVTTGLANDVSASLDANELTSVFEIQATLASGVKLPAVETVLDKELERLAKEGPTPEELKRAKTGLRLSFASQLQQLNANGGEGGRAGTLQRLNHYLGDPGALPRVLQAYGHVTPADVTRVLQTHLSPNLRATVVTEPQ